MKKKKRICIFLILLTAVNSRRIYGVEGTAEEHVYTEWIVTKEPTCTAQGERYKECTLHGGKIIEELSRTDHSYSLTEETPTCTQSGKKTYVCNRCGHRYEVAYGEPFGHDFIAETVVEAICEQEGLITYTCRHCNEQYSEAIPAFSHKYEEWIVEEKPQPETVGKKYQECIYCKEKNYVVLPMAPEEPKQGLTILDKVLITMDGVLLAGFLFFIRMDLLLIIWFGRKRKKYEEEMRKVREHGDGCGFY